MSSKRLLPLVILLAVLVIVTVTLKRRPSPTRLSDETGFERLLPQTFHPERISGFDLYRGAKPEEAVKIRHRHGTWVVTSHYDAPGNADKIKRLLDNIETLEGELRSDRAELLGDFRLEEAQALHLRVYTERAEKAAIHLLAGKSRGRDGFFRTADDARVYSVNLNLHSEAGLRGDATDEAPQAKPWLDLQIHNVAQEQITAVEIQTPERHLSFARQKRSTSPATDTPQQAPVHNMSAETERAWTLVAPEVGYTVKQGALDDLISTLRTLRGEEIADPAHVATYGLDAPTYRAILTVQSEGQEVHEKALFLGKETTLRTGGRYARLGQTGPIYIVPRWSFERLFPKSKELLELPHLYRQPEEVIGLTWQRGDASWTLTRHPAGPQTEGETPPASLWQFTNLPHTPIAEQAIDALLETIKKLTTEDWIERLAKQAARQRAVLALGLTLRDTRRVDMTIHAASDQGENRYYLYVRDRPGIFVVSSAAYETLTEALVNLHSAMASPPTGTSAAP